MATACAKPPPNGQGLTPVRRHDPLAAVDVSALSGIIGMLSAINRNTVRLRSEQVSAFVGIRSSAAFGRLPLCEWLYGRGHSSRADVSLAPQRSVPGLVVVHTTSDLVIVMARRCDALPHAPRRARESRLEHFATCRSSLHQCAVSHITRRRR